MQEHSHPAIISREDWEAVQLELARREKFRVDHGIRNTGSTNFDRFYSRVFCSACGGKYVRKAWKGMLEPFWKCENKEKKKGHTCEAENVMEADLRKAMVIAWNELVSNRDEKVKEWEQTAALGNSLEKYRARLMIACTAEGPLTEDVPEMTRMFLEKSSWRDRRS